MSKDLPPSRTAEQFVVRFPEGMRDRIAEAAKASGRSMNAEIVQRLADSFENNNAASGLLEIENKHLAHKLNSTRRVALHAIEVMLEAIKKGVPEPHRHRFELAADLLREAVRTDEEALELVRKEFKANPGPLLEMVRQVFHTQEEQDQALQHLLNPEPKGKRPKALGEQLAAKTKA